MFLLKEAIKTLNTLQSNAETIQQTVRNSSDFEKQRFQEVEKFLKKTGVPLERLDTLSVIHVAGTKGKVMKYPTYIFFFNKNQF